MNITMDKDVMIFKKDNKYSVAVSKKNSNGEWESAYFPIEFNKNVEIENKTLISIKNSWLSFYKWEYDGKKGTKFFIKCTEYELVQGKQEQSSEEPKNSLNDDVFKDFGESIEIDNNSLPF